MSSKQIGFDLTNIGQLLKEKREEKGLTIDDASTALKLRKTLVTALESGDWKGLPHPIYVKGYVKEYARVLNMEETILPFLVAPVSDAAPDEEKPVEAVPPQRRNGFFQIKLPSRPYIIYGIVIVLIGVYFIFELKHRHIDTPASATRRVEAPELERAGHVSSKSYDQTREGVPGLSQTKKLMITCHERTWISVVIDGVEKKEFMLNPQEIIVLNGKERFDLLVGNAGGVKLFMNGKDTGFQGETREVRRITLS